MDTTDIAKVASRKRMVSDAEKLREKITRETSKIIKLKVAQDTAYWDLKEKLRQVEINHEGLQQNMVDVQMQHEKISGQYQDELRLRPETLNKLNSTREICDVLEKYSGSLKETLARCKADQVALCDAYNSSGQKVQEMTLKQEKLNETNKHTIELLQEKLKLTTDHQSQLIEYFTATKQQADLDLNEAKSKLTAALADKDALFTAANELNRKLDTSKLEIEKKEQIISNLQGDIKQLLKEFTSQSNEMKNAMSKLDKDYKDASESNDALKRALANQETYTNSVREQNNQLQEKISTLEEDQISLNSNLKTLETQLQDAYTERDNLKNDILSLNMNKELLEKAIDDKTRVIAHGETEYQILKDEVHALETEKAEVLLKLESFVEECNAKSDKINEFIKAAQTAAAKYEELEETLKLKEETAGAKIQELLVGIEEKDKDLELKVETINSLMVDVKNATDVGSKLENNLQKLKKEFDDEKNENKEKEEKLLKQVSNLESAVRNKDGEISRQLTIILEMRSEKERLQDKIQSMQSTIDNIQKELTGRIASFDNRIPAEQDDNAVMLTPARKASKPDGQSPSAQQPLFAVPRSEPKQLDTRLFNFLSDSSMDGDTIDPNEVNRRFEALSRGERLPKVPLSSLKRRRGGPAAQGGLRLKPSADDDNVALSQVKSDLKMKERSFFKNNRLEHKPKKFK